MKFHEMSSLSVWVSFVKPPKMAQLTQRTAPPSLVKKTILKLPFERSQSLLFYGGSRIVFRLRLAAQVDQFQGSRWGRPNWQVSDLQSCLEHCLGNSAQKTKQGQGFFLKTDTNFWFFPPNDWPHCSLYVSPSLLQTICHTFHEILRSNLLIIFWNALNHMFFSLISPFVNFIIFSGFGNLLKRSGQKFKIHNFQQFRSPWTATRHRHGTVKNYPQNSWQSLEINTL